MDVFLSAIALFGAGFMACVFYIDNKSYKRALKEQAAKRERDWESERAKHKETEKNV